MAVDGSEMVLSRPPTTISSLSNELILMIFEEVRLSELALEDENINARKTLPALRVVCKRFNGLATPIRYRNFTLQTERPIKKRTPQPKIVRKRVAEDVKHFTQHITVTGKINWLHVVHNNGSLPRLKSTSWNFHARSENWVEQNLSAIPASILRPGVTVSVSGTGYYRKIISLIPPEHVSKLHLGYWHPGHTWDMDAHDALDLEYNPKFKDYIIAAKNLETLNYDLGKLSPPRLAGAAPNFPSFVAGEKMPALKHLVLTGYHWLHTVKEVKSSWNFSKLETLDIIGMNHDDFFGVVDAKMFPQLRQLRLGTFACRVPGNRNRKRKQIRLHNFLRGMSQLEVLSMNAYTEDFPLDILMAMKNLKVLELTQAISFFRGGAPTPRLDMHDLEELLQYLPQLMRIHIDFKTWPGNFKRRLLDIVSQFPGLRKIEFNNQGGNMDPSEDLNTFTAMTKLPNLQRVYIHHGQYVKAGGSGLYDCGNKRWKRHTSSRWAVAGKS
ncbi:hypothetical protein DL95DRAFT_400304 [Leptodontidium sp. 2 PMI_412]|nr:hypothetical protein DL95DRAFT_400304 [Leptodontidium sp. 2 PMI_412]